MARQDYQHAVAAFAELARLAPRTAEFHSNLGVSLYFAGRQADAAAPLREALKLNPRLDAARYFLGLSLAEGGQCRQALDYLLKDFRRVTDEGLQRLMGVDAARCALALGRPESAVDVVAVLERRFPSDAEVLYLSAHVYSELSTRASEHLLRTAPGSYRAHQFNAEVLEFQGKWKEAAEEYRRVLALQPGLPGVHLELGRLLLQGENPSADEARREFEAELKADPTSSAAEYELGELARKDRLWDEATAHFQRSVHFDPGFAPGYVGLAKAHLGAGHGGEALKALQEAARLAPGDPAIRYQLAAAYRREGREAEAEKELAAYRELEQKLKAQGLEIRKQMQSPEPQP